MAKKLNFNPKSADFMAGLERGNLAGAAEMARILSIQTREVHKAFMKHLKDLDKQNTKPSVKTKRKNK